METNTKDINHNHKLPMMTIDQKEEDKKEDSPTLQTLVPAEQKDESCVNMCRNTNLITLPDGSVAIAVESTPIEFVLIIKKNLIFRRKSCAGIA
jgi:hypothetical protein